LKQIVVDPKWVSLSTLGRLDPLFSAPEANAISAELRGYYDGVLQICLNSCRESTGLISYEQFQFSAIIFACSGFVILVDDSVPGSEGNPR
jgi:hypothetical protein